MYNQKKAQIKNQEKMLREHTIDPKCDDNQAIWDKELKHRSDTIENTTENQLNSTGRDASCSDLSVIEKVLDERNSYVVHRSDTAELPVPPMSALVEFNRKNRVDADWNTNQKAHWSQTTDDKKQQGALPKTKKNVGQHDKIVLNNDPRRFQDAGYLPVHTTQSENDDNHNKQTKIKPLVGNITTADIHRVAENIKKGHSVEYDAAIVAILRDADRDRRELTSVEESTIANLKMARTRAMLIK